MSERKRLLILTDSLALPRLVPEACTYQDTWPSLIKMNFDFEVHQVSIGGATSQILLRQAEYHQAFLPDVVVVQCGIVDCSPRFATAFEMEIVKRIPVVRNWLPGVLNKPNIRKIRRITYVNKHQFHSNLKRLKSKFSSARFIMIGITSATKEYEIILPGVSSNIAEYNNIMASLDAEFISLSELPRAGLMSDLHHINAIGQKYIFDRLKPILLNA